eukprot:CAMPEP_0174257392 /NCGR_PEP_ID=MMETSP0439-20130205/6538_1 /TAXON_ID=0 /ORGANISM="Stereomyxa ramosa, Strain Chinc5" /LENGTH=189 /DNA_ID=CAMNT_0015340459 /DNA_START=38 /DNA_END=607 /DNA_ORIENTATION=-
MPTNYKIVVLGTGGVGKSALTLQFVQGIFVEKYDPTLEDCYRVQQEVEGKNCVLEIFDTAADGGKYSGMMEHHLKNGEGFVLVYSVIASSSFKDAEEGGWRGRLQKAKGTEEEVPMVVVGNKKDLEDQREVSSSQGEDLAKRLGCPFLESSAKTRFNVDRVFFTLLPLISSFNAKRRLLKKKSSLCSLF